ncbi:DUF302 domain-containing protein [Anderseniella sp. Alg231-50]|uniref:DUF302 domain-containing protein n=1 Tax=Anderseniella sp. Alg231-50 TaxID=1922226 RepID=UPI000D54BAA2
MKFNFTLAGIALAAAVAVMPASVSGSEPASTIKTVTGDFDEVFGDLQDAVINRGLVIDYVGDVGKMLERTAEAAKGTASAVPYLNARYLQFCSAVLTHEATDADVRNLAMCPYVVFAYETQAEPGRISVGYRQVTLSPTAKSQTAQAKVHGLLEAVVSEAAGANP